jgi:hypothetical protein
VRPRLFALTGVLGIWVAAVSGQTGTLPPPTQAAAPAQCARTWAGHEPEIERFLAEATVERLEDIDVGITRPKRAHVAPGGPIESFAWKPIRPGIYNGFWESYQSEVAAYRLDRLIGLGMVPVAVERHVDGMLGAAIMWVGPVRMWSTFKREERPSGREWRIQVLESNMFDNLICNKDRNQGNLLVDGDGHLILIDHSRAFITADQLPVKFTQVHASLWARMGALSEASLTEALGDCLTPRQIRAILARRDRMKAAIDELVKTRGAATVFVG